MQYPQQHVGCRATRFCQNRELKWAVGATALVSVCSVHQRTKRSQRRQRPPSLSLAMPPCHTLLSAKAENSDTKSITPSSPRSSSRSSLICLKTTSDINQIDWVLRRTPQRSIRFIARRVLRWDCVPDAKYRCYPRKSYESFTTCSLGPPDPFFLCGKSDTRNRLPT